MSGCVVFGGGWWYFLEMLVNGGKKWQGRRQKEDNKVFVKGGVGRKRKEEPFYDRIRNEKETTKTTKEMKRKEERLN